MKPAIHRGISAEKLRRIVPERFRPALPAHPVEPLTAIIFSDSVITGRVARKAVAALGCATDSCLLCIGRSFTAEAADIVLAAGGLLVSELSGITWTDDSLFKLRTSLATNKKWPDLPLG